MFQIDDDFLQAVGLNDMPDEQKDTFKQYILDQLELRIGEILTEGVDEARLDEFEGFMNRNDEMTREWLALNAVGYEQTSVYAQLREANPAADEASLASEYASLRWLEINRPDYTDVVKRVLDELKDDLIEHRDQLLAE